MASLVKPSYRTGGKFKVELFFGPDKSLHKPFRGIVSVWESHSDKDGDSDVLISMCPRCKIPIMANSYGVLTDEHGKAYNGAVCHSCGTKWRVGDVIQFVGASYTIDGWADLVLKYYAYLGGDIDVYMKRFYGRLHQAQQEYVENRTAKARENFQIKTAASYELSIYSLPRMIVDTSAGSDLKSALKGFLSA